MRLDVLALVLGLTLGLGACHGAPLGAGEGRWLRLETQHFAVYTDLPRARAERQAGELEHLLDAYQRNGWEVRGELPIKLNVVLFSHPHDFERFGRGGSAATT